MSSEHLNEKERRIVQSAVRAREAGDYAKVRELLGRHPDLFRKRIIAASPDTALQYLPRDYALEGDLEGIKAFVEHGADINAPRSDRDREGLISTAANFGRTEVVRWLLERGAVFTQEREGVPASQSLIGAAMEGHLDVVRLLVEAGAPLNGPSYTGATALDMALGYGHQEVAHYLRSHGALTSEQVRGEPPPAPIQPEAGTLRAHLQATMGEVDDLSLQPIVPADVPVRVHRVTRGDEQFLVTEGTSAAVMPADEGGRGHRRAEFYVRLPGDWPLTPRALARPKHSWPLRWLLTAARMPHEVPGFTLRDATVLTNGEPPRALARGTKLSCLLAVTTADEWGVWRRADGEEVGLYLLYPIYTEERDIVEEEGADALVVRFRDAGFPLHVEPRRANVATQRR